MVDDFESYWKDVRRKAPADSDVSEAVMEKAERVFRFVKANLPKGTPDQTLEDVSVQLMHLSEFNLDDLFLHPDKLPREFVSRGGIILGQPEYVGTMPIRTEVTVLAADPPREPVGWTVHEMTDEDIAEENSPENVERRAQERGGLDPEIRSFETTHAALYPPHHPEGTPEGMCAWPRSHGWMSLRVLPELTGRPWNNAAANFLVCLRPSAVRVTYGSVTLDSMSWRVTVHLNQNGTIRRIEQEVEVGLTGFRNGHDASLYLAHEDDYLKHPVPNMIVNPRALAQLRLDTEDD
jgi:hypothetical protein